MGGRDNLTVGDSGLVDCLARPGLGDERSGLADVVVAAQLTAGATSEDAVEWLRPLQDIESNAAGVGHVDVHTGFDGVARTLLPREADDQGLTFALYWPAPG